LLGIIATWAVLMGFSQNAVPTIHTPSTYLIP